jgi:hypothetical protein
MWEAKFHTLIQVTGEIIFYIYFNP